MWEKSCTSCPNFGEGGGGGKLHKIQKNSSFFRESVPKIICHKSKVTFLRGMLSQIIVERVKCKHLSESIRFSDPKWKIQKVYRIYKLIEMSGTLYKYVHKMCQQQLWPPLTQTLSIWSRWWVFQEISKIWERKWTFKDILNSKQWVFK